MVAVRAAGCAVEAEVNGAVAATEAVLAECRRRAVVPRDLRVRRASLEDVFVRLTGQMLDPTGAAAWSGLPPFLCPGGR
jgi:hypothetical protein